MHPIKNELTLNLYRLLRKQELVRYMYLIPFALHSLYASIVILHESQMKERMSPLTYANHSPSNMMPIITHLFKYHQPNAFEYLTDIMR